jgi:hypothetical protein
VDAEVPLESHYEWLIRQRKDTLRELSKHLSPENQNVKNGDIIACIRDLAQIALTSKENAASLQHQLDHVFDYLDCSGEDE